MEQINLLGFAKLATEAICRQRTEQERAVGPQPEIVEPTLRLFGAHPCLSASN
jgi:hypothetical protein